MVFFKNFDPCKKRDRKATERSLLLAASKLFAEKGFENTRTLEIAKEAGANEALIGRYFGGKEGLLIAVIKNEEALKIVIDQKDPECARLDVFPEYAEAKSLKNGIKIFFKNGMKAIEIKEEFMKIGLSRALVDADMAAVIKKNFLDQHMPLVTKGLRTYPEFKGKHLSELNAVALLIMTTNFNMNFQNLRIYNLDAKLVNQALDIFAESIAALYS